MRILEDEDSELEEFLGPLIQKLERVANFDNPRNKIIKKINSISKNNLFGKSLFLLEDVFSKYT